MQKKFKVMAYYRSTGFWDCCRQIKLSKVIGQRNEVLINELVEWQVTYDTQFRKFTYEFDWDSFNKKGRELTEKIREAVLVDVPVYYVESDDRDFFNPEDCRRAVQQDFVE